MNTQIQAIYKKLVERALLLRDIRVAGQVVFAVLVLLITWSGVKSIQSNYALQKQITALTQQNQLKKLENTNTQLKNEYYKSDQYLELSARENFGLATPGEKLVIIPKEAALARTVPFEDKPSQVAIAASKERSNFEAWVNFFLNRTPER